MVRVNRYPFRDYSTLEEESEYKENAFILEQPDDTDEEYQIKMELSGYLEELAERNAFKRGYLCGLNDAKEQMEELWDSSNNVSLKEMEKEIEEFVDEKRKWSKKFHKTFKKKVEEEN